MDAKNEITRAVVMCARGSSPFVMTCNEGLAKIKKLLNYLKLDATFELTGKDFMIDVSIYEGIVVEAEANLLKKKLLVEPDAYFEALKKFDFKYKSFEAYFYINDIKFSLIANKNGKEGLVINSLSIDYKKEDMTVKEMLDLFPDITVAGIEDNAAAELEQKILF